MFHETQKEMVSPIYSTIFVDDGLGLDYDRTQLEVTLLEEFVPIKRGDKNKIMKHSVFAVSEKGIQETDDKDDRESDLIDNELPSSAIFPLILQHAASGSSADDETQREDESNYIGEVAVRFHEKGHKKFLAQADLNVSAVVANDKIKALIEDPNFDPKKLGFTLRSSHFKLNMVAMKLKAKQMASQHYVLNKASFGEYVTCKKREEGNAYAQQQANKGDIDFSIKGCSFLFEARPEGMSDEAAELQIESALLEAMNELLHEDRKVEYWGQETDCQDGTDHARGRRIDVEIGVKRTFRMRPGTTTSGATGVKDPLTVYTPEGLTPEGEEIFKQSSSLMHQCVKAALFEILELPENAAVKLSGAEKTKVDALSYRKFAEYIQKPPKGKPNYSDLLIKHQAVLEKHLLQWIGSPVFQRANTMLVKPALKDVADLKFLLKEITHDIMNSLSEGLKAQANSGYRAFLGPNPRYSQLRVVAEADLGDDGNPPISLTARTEGNEMSQAQADSDSIKARGHLNAKADMRDALETRNLNAYLALKGLKNPLQYYERLVRNGSQKPIFHIVSDLMQGRYAKQPSYTEYEEYEHRRTYKPSEALQRLREIVLALRIAEIKAGRNAEPGLSLEGQLAKRAFENAAIACALAQYPEVKRSVFAEIAQRVESGYKLRAVDLDILAGISDASIASEREPILASIIQNILETRSSIMSESQGNPRNHRIFRYHSRIIRAVPDVAKGLLEWIKDDKDDRTPEENRIVESLIEDKTIRDLLVDDLIARALVAAEAQEADVKEGKEATESRAADVSKVTEPIFTERDLQIIDSFPRIAERLAFKSSEIESKAVREALFKNEKVRSILVSDLERRQAISAQKAAVMGVEVKKPNPLDQETLDWMQLFFAGEVKEAREGNEGEREQAPSTTASIAERVEALQIHYVEGSEATAGSDTGSSPQATKESVVAQGCCRNLRTVLRKLGLCLDQHQLLLAKANRLAKQPQIRLAPLLINNENC